MNGKKSPVGHLSAYIEFLLKRYLDFIDSMIKSEDDFINSLNVGEINSKPGKLISLDITNMYESISLSKILSSVKYFIDHHHPDNTVEISWQFEKFIIVLLISVSYI